MTTRKKLVGRKLLGATLGLASVSLVGCVTTSGNLIAPPVDAGSDAPPDVPPTEDTGTTEDAGNPGSKK